MTVLKLCAAAITALALVGCSQPASKDEAGIAAANKKYMDFVAAKDAGGAASMFAEDGAAFPPNAPRVEGRDNLKKFFEDFFALPGLESLTWRSDKVVFAASGEMAVDIGPYEMKMGGSSEIGKTVVVWVKRDGEWKVLTDMFSGDGAAMAAAAAPAAAPAAGDAMMEAPPADAAAPPMPAFAPPAEPRSSEPMPAAPPMPATSPPPREPTNVTPPTP